MLLDCNIVEEPLS